MLFYNNTSSPVHLDPGTAIVLSSLIGAGSAAVQARKSRKVAKASQRAADRRQRAQQKIAKDQQTQERFREKVQNQVAQNQVQDIQNVGLREKGIAPLGRNISAAVLNDASQTGP